MAPQPFRHAVPSAQQGRPATSTALPSDITAQATRRLGAFAALVGALAMAWLLLGLASGDTEFMALVRLGTLALICMSSAALAWIARTLSLIHI